MRFSWTDLVCLNNSQFYHENGLFGVVCFKKKKKRPLLCCCSLHCHAESLHFWALQLCLREDWPLLVIQCKCRIFVCNCDERLLTFNIHNVHVITCLYDINTPFKFWAKYKCILYSAKFSKGKKGHLSKQHIGWWCKIKYNINIVDNNQF